MLTPESSLWIRGSGAATERRKNPTFNGPSHSYALSYAKSNDSGAGCERAGPRRVDGSGSPGPGLHAAGRPDLFRPADPDALRSFLSERLSAGSIVLVAEDAGASLEGYVLAEVVDRPQSPFKLPHTCVHVHHIAVDERARRRRVGESLIAETVKRAHQVGAISVSLDSWSFNTKAHRFFGAQGFNATRLLFERSVGMP